MAQAFCVLFSITELGPKDSIRNPCFYNYPSRRMSKFFQLVPDVIFMDYIWLSLTISILFCFEGDKTGSKGVKTEKQDSKESKLGVEQEEKPPAIPSAYDEDLMVRAAMYGVLFQAYADKVKGDYALLLFLSYFFLDNILFIYSNRMRQMKEWLCIRFNSQKWFPCNFFLWVPSHYSANGLGAFSNLSSRNCYLDLTPNSLN